MPVILNYLDMNNHHSDYADETLRRITDTFGRYSLTDNSVLTEDTDSFIIGDRIWVGGSKPGQIAFIGETQFAPGEWAGIVLDLAIGKNDGSVGGIRYFQCEPKRGVFSRLTRLTRAPLPGLDDSSICSSSYAVSSTPLNNGVRRRVESPVSPTGSVKSSLRTPPPFSVSNTSLSSIPHVIDFKIGDRVIIKSSQGSKVGTVRFIGTTDFAPGEWCGVELDEPRGKNNGSVDGKKYFECAAMFGLFAPVAKVSKSPLKYKPGNCVVHTGATATPGTLPPSGIKRMGSRESMASMTSSITSAASGARRVRLGVNSLTPQKSSPKPVVTPAFPTRAALQDVLREKQQHIEQLLKERDLDRTEFTKVASHAEELERKLTVQRAEYEQYRLETESKLREYVDVLTKLNKDRSITLSQLDDEKRKTEDMQFKFEEAAIIKHDIEVNVKTQAMRIQDLEHQLESERQKSNHYEGDSSKLFEAEEALVEAREEVDTLKKDIEALKKINDNLLKEQAVATDSINNLKENINKITTELKTVKEDDAKSLQQLQQDHTTSVLSNQEACTQLAKEIEGYKSKLQEKSDTCQKQAEEIATLRIELEQNKELVKQNVEKVNLGTETESKLTNTIEKLKQDLSSKIFDVENSSEVIKQKDVEIFNLKTQFETVTVQNKVSSEDLESKYKNEIEQLKNQLNTKTDELKTQTEKLNEVHQLFTRNTDENLKLTSDLKKAKDDFESIFKNQAQYDKEIESKTNEAAKMLTELQQKTDEIHKSASVIKQSQDDIASKDKDIDNLKKESSLSLKHLEDERTHTNKLKEQVQALQLTMGDLERKVTAVNQQNTDLSEDKIRLEAEIKTLISSSGDYSEKLQQLNADLKMKEDILTTKKTEFTEKVQKLEHTNQELQLQLQNVELDAERTKSLYQEKLQRVSELELKVNRFEKALDDEAKTRGQLEELQHLLDDAKICLRVADGEKADLQKELSIAKSLSHQNDLNIEQLHSELIEKEGLLRDTKTKLAEKLQNLENVNQEQLLKIELLQENKSSSEQKLKATLESEKSLKELNEELKLNFENIKLHVTELQSSINEKDLALKTVLEEKCLLVAELSKAVSLSGDTSTKMHQLTSDLTTQENVMATTKAKLAETAQELEHAKKELSNTQKIEIELQDKLQNVTEAQEKLQQQYDTIFSDKQKAMLDLTTLQHVISEQDLTLKEKSKIESDLKEQLEKMSQDAQIILKTLEDVKVENSSIKDQISQKSENENKLKQEYQKEHEKNNGLAQQLEKLQLQLEAKDDDIQNLKKECDLFKQSNASISVKDSRIAELTNEMHTSQQLVTQLQIDKGNLELVKIDFEKQLAASNQQTNNLTNQLAELHVKIESDNKSAEELRIQKNNYAHIFQQLQLNEKQMQQLVVRLENESGNSDRNIVELAKTIQIGGIDEQTNNLMQLQHNLDTTRQDLKDAKNQLKNQQSEVLRLQDALAKATQKNSNGTVQNMPQNNNNNHKTADTHQQLLEEKELAEGQIQFLNAIIVDMQRKNEEQKMRIELLESGFSPAAASELKLYGMPHSTVAPRIYCDICEEFDKHQTEDCPVQGSDFDAPAPINHTRPKNVTERPYCDICEVFGHSTEDCKEDETF